MPRRAGVSLLLFGAVAGLVFLALYLKRGANAPPVPEPTEAGAGNYARLGPVGLSVEAVRLGKVRLRGMMGQDGESKDDVFTVKTRFKLLDATAPVKQFALQRDGSMLAGGGLKLTDDNGREYKQVAGFGFDAVKGRRSGEAILTAESPEATDVLTFESVAGAPGDLLLEVPANYQVKQPDGTFLQPKEPGTFRFRIPKSLWSAQPPATDAKPGNWATVGPVSVSVESVRVGKIKISKSVAFFGEYESKEDAFVVAVKVKLADPAARVKKPPFMLDAGIPSMRGPALALRRATGGDPFSPLFAPHLDRVVGRQPDTVELTAEKPEMTDLLTFTAEAGKANELVLTIYPD